MNQLKLFDNEHLRSVYVHRFIYLASDALPDHLSLDPLDNFTLDLLALYWLRF